MEVAPVKPTIKYDTFKQIDIRVGLIERVEEVDGADQLVRLIVDFGDHKRKVIAGIKQERENPAELQGQQALFVVNLPPRKICGEVSEGMLFDIGYEDGILPALAMPERSVPNGARLG